MKFGIIGYGRMGKLYHNVLDKLGISVSFVSDLIKAETELKFYTDYKEALNAEHVDGLIVTTTGPSHYEIADYAITKNIRYIVCEKPFTTSVKQADSLINRIRNTDTRLTINYSRRFSDSYNKLFGLLYDENIIGIPRSMVIHCGAGGLSAVGTHFFDLCRYLLSEKLKSVYAVPVDKHLPNPRGTQFEDPGGYVLLNFENEKRAIVDIGDDLGLQPLIEIICEYGRVFVDELHKTIEIRGRKKDDQNKPKHLYGIENVILKKETFDFESLENLIKTMLENLVSDKPLLVTPEMAREKIEIYSAIRKSFETNTPIILPLNDCYYEKEFSVT